MATSKLLKPTNVTISIPEFTDQPDQRVNSNCLDKEADAINSLSEQIAPIVFGTNTKNLTQNLQDGWVNNVPNDNAPHFVRIISQYGDFCGYLNRYGNVYGSGVLTRYTGEIANVSLDNGTASIYLPPNMMAEANVSIGTNQYDSLYYGDYTFTLPSGAKVYSALIKFVTDNHDAFVGYVKDAGNCRVYSRVPNITVTVQILYRK